MKRLFFMIGCMLLATVSYAQNPAWTKKAAQAVFTLKTFGADGSLLASVNGFFIDEQGQAVSSFAPFKNAQRAVIIDAQGKEMEVDCLIGYNDMYDVAKFHVIAKKTQALSIAQNAASNGATLWLMPYAVKKVPACTKGTVSSAEQFGEGYTYYTLDMETSDQQVGCPILNEQGEAVGILQPSASGKSTTGYAVSARYANSLRMSALSQNDPVLRTVKITKALPDDQSEATLALYVSSSTMSTEEYDQLINRFIEKFPQSSDGYIYRARQKMAKDDFQGADDDMKQAIKVGDMKDDAHYQYAQMMYQKDIYQNDVPFEAWSLERALEESEKASKINPQPLYRQQQAQIYYAMKKFDEAYRAYEELSKTPLRSADNFYAAAQCKLQQDDKKAALALLDSAMSTFSKPYVKTAAPYLRARAQLSMECRRYQLAINDMNDLVALEPNDATLWAEKASYELRVYLKDQALESGRECIRLAPEDSDGYLMSGIALCLKGEKVEGLQNLQKAKELGNDQAQTFIEKYSK